MSRREEILDRHGEAIRAAALRHNVSSISLVGSVARGTDTGDSDCDFVCEFVPGATLLDLAGLELELMEILGCEVDVASLAALEPPYSSMLEDAVAL